MPVWPLLSAGSMFADDAFIALRATGWHGAVALSDVDQVVSAHDIVVVAVRHAGLTADQLLGPVALAFAGAGLASFAGVGVVDVSPPGVTKAAAVAEEVGCDAGDVIAFGDMPNDLPLFEWSGWACAVANAHPSVLAAADEIVPSNDDDGVARTVERLLR